MDFHVPQVPISPIYYQLYAWHEDQKLRNQWKRLVCTLQEDERLALECLCYYRWQCVLHNWIVYFKRNIHRRKRNVHRRRWRRIYNNYNNEITIVEFYKFAGGRLLRILDWYLGIRIKVVDEWEYNMKKERNSVIKT